MGCWTPFIPFSQGGTHLRPAALPPGWLTRWRLTRSGARHRLAPAGPG